MKHTEILDIKQKKLRNELSKPKTEQNRHKIFRLRESIKRNKEIQNWRRTRAVKKKLRRIFKMPMRTIEELEEDIENDRKNKN
jgi:ribosomal protein L32E